MMQSSFNHAPMPKGPAGYPLLGHAPQFLRDRLGFLLRCACEYGEVVTLNIGGETCLLTSPEDIKHVLVNNPDNYDKSPRLTGPKGKLLSGEGLLTSVGAAHLRQRRMLQPVFYRRVIESFAETVTNTTEQILAGWEDGSEIDINREMSTLAQRVIIRTLFGLDFKDEAEQLADAVTARRHYFEHVFFSMVPFPEHLPPWKRHDYRKAMNYIDETIYREARTRREASGPGSDMLSMLLRARYTDGTGMTDRQIRDEVMTFLITGYETIAEALTWTWYLLSQHSDEETKFRAEVRDVLRGRTPSAEDLPQLQYTGMVLSESIRLYPPTWIFIRIARQADVLPSGATITAGAKLYLSPYVMHRNPRYFPDPDRFDPERFTEAAKKERPQFAYFPFGGGARVCIGEHFAKMEGILVLAMIAQRFKLTLVPGQKIIPEPKMTLRPKNGIRMRMEDSQLVDGGAR